MGGAIGIAATGAIFFGLLPGGGIDTVAEPATRSTAARGPLAAEFGDAFVRTLWFPAAMFVAALLASFLLPRRATHHG